MNRFTIKSRLYFLVCLMLIGCIGISVIGIKALSQTIESFNSVYLDRIVPLKDLKLISDKFAVDIVGASNKALIGTISFHQAELDLKEADSQIDVMWPAYLKKQATPLEISLNNALNSSIEGIQKPLERLKVILNRGDTESLSNFLKNDMYKFIDPITQQLSDLAQLHLDESKREYERSLDLYQTARALLVGFILLMVIGGAVFAHLMLKSILNPLATLKLAAARVAAGDFTEQMVIHGQNEIAEVQGSLKSMQNTLKDTMISIHSSATQLASAAEELHAVSDSTASGIHIQNEEMQMAATAVTEMSAAIDEVAGNATRTSTASSNAKQYVDEGQKKVISTRDTIDHLSHRLEQTTIAVFRLADEVTNIGKVSDVIGSIAEQTNLLALNAAIEAARAGEAGRGFAVVADEVRNLAQRTQTSTQEIDRMITAVQNATEESVNEMQQSRELAGKSLEMASDADCALTQIFERITEIDSMNIVIASATEEQAAVAREADRNLLEIKSITESSANGVEETSVASEELARMAMSLNSIVDRFKLYSDYP